MLRHIRFLLRHQRAIPRRPYGTSTVIAEESTRDDFNLNERTRERGQRLFYHDTIRSNTRYNSSKIVIQPTIRHLIVRLRGGDRSEPIILSSGLKDGVRPQDVLEPIVFHIMLILEDLKTGTTYAALMREQLQQMEQTIDSRFNNAGDASSLEKEVDVETFLRHARAPVPPRDDELVVSLQQCLIRFLAISKSLSLQKYPSKQRKRLLQEGIIMPKYTVKDDLLPWILSLSATSISKSCEVITNVSNIPAFVTSNILLRSPTSANELYLQLDIWTTFQSEILRAYFKKPSYLVDIIENLLFFGVLYDASKTPDIFTATLGFMSTKEADQINFKFLSPKLINLWIWKVVFNYFRSVQHSHHRDSSKIIKTQEILVSFLSHKKIVGADTNPHTHLNLEGHMGIVLAIKYISVKKAEKLFNIADVKFLRNQNLHSISKQESSPYLCTKIMLLKTPEELVHNFNTAILEYPNKSFLWLALIKKLIEFDLLTTTRSLKILNQLVEQTDRIIITKDIVQHLLIPIQSLEDINLIITNLLHERNPSESPLFSSLSNYIFPKYLSILYKNPDTISPVSYLDVWPRNEAVSVPVGPLSNIEVARYMFKHCSQRKTSNVVGIMLNGEARYQPDHVYSLYKQSFDQRTMPDESSLVALLTASMKTTNPRDKSSCLMWGDLYAPQVSIGEFKKHVARDSGPLSDLDSANIYPSAKLWQAYINVLAKYDYTAELADIIHWWELLHYKPNGKTLLMLLASLPEQFGERYIQHNEKVNQDHRAVSPTKTANVNDWPWPTLGELRDYRKHKRLFQFT